MIDIDKILEIVDTEKEVFLARENKPMLVILDIEKYKKLKESAKNSQKQVFENNALKESISTVKMDQNDYPSMVKRSLIE